MLSSRLVAPPTARAKAERTPLGYVAAFALHLAAAKILLLAEAHEAMGR